jgi:hypothetical protein
VLGAIWSEQVVQEDALRLEQVVTACEANQRGEGIAGSQECDDNDRQDCLAELELRLFGVEAWQYEIAGESQPGINGRWHGTARLATYPPKIIHEATRAVRRQYHGVFSRRVWPFSMSV